MLTRGAFIGSDFLKITNRRFCNSPNKIIGWYKGYPSYYLLSPPLMSKPAANALTSKIMSIYQWRKLPELMSIAVTDACNCDCEYCSFTGMKKNAPVLKTNEIKNVIRQVQELGAATINIVGGEPLLHENLCDIIASVDKELSQVILFTNGYFLKEKAKQLYKAGLTSVIVSIDSAHADIHNRKKGCDRLFERAIEGIREAKKAKLLVGISTVIERDDIDNGSLVEIFKLAKNLKVNDIIIFDAIPTGNYAKRDDLDWQSSEQEKIIKICAEYNWKKDYPGIHPYAFSKSFRGIGCAGGVSQFYVSPYGEVCPCDFNPKSVGNVKEEPLYVLWDRFSREGFACSSLEGCRMNGKNIPVKKSSKG
jgi:MoaA/NifB/PqqE/SkfB family radical SAM enzyme